MKGIYNGAWSRAIAADRSPKVLTGNVPGERMAADSVVTGRHPETEDLASTDHPSRPPALLSSLLGGVRGRPEVAALFPTEPR